MASENLNKSIDDLIDQVFAADEVEKSIEIAKDASETADEAVKKAPKGQKDEARGAGRPKQISDVPQNDQDGARAKDYDASISEKGKEKDQEEANQVKEMNQIKAKGGNDASAPKAAPFKKSVSDEDYEELQAFRKAKQDSEVEELKKAEAQKQEDLIKSVVDRTAEKVAAKYENEISGLRKSLDEQLTMTKAMAEAPRTAKSITNIEALEKSTEKPAGTQNESLTKSEAADLAVEAFEKGIISEDEAIEMDGNGYIYNPQSRAKFEAYVAKKFS